MAGELVHPSLQCWWLKLKITGIAKLKKSWNTTKARADATVHTALWAMAKLMVHSGARKQSQEENDAAEDTKILPFSQPIIKIPLQMHLLHLSLLLFLPPNHIRLEVASFPGKLAFIIFESAIHHNQVVYKKWRWIWTDQVCEAPLEVKHMFGHDSRQVTPFGLGLMCVLWLPLCR